MGSSTQDRNHSGRTHLHVSLEDDLLVYIDVVGLSLVSSTLVSQIYGDLGRSYRFVHAGLASGEGRNPGPARLVSQPQSNFDQDSYPKQSHHVDDAVT